MNAIKLFALCATVALTACGGGTPTPEENLQAVTSLAPGAASNPCVISVSDYAYLINIGILPKRPTESVSLLSRYDWKPPFLVLKPEFKQALITLATIPVLGPYYDPAETTPPPYVCK